MRYIVMQITLTDSQIALINESKGELPDFYNRYLRATTFPKKEAVQAAFEAGDYETVCEIETDNLEQVFAIGNGMGDENKITRLAKMKSVSVGDIVIDRNDGNRTYYVDTFGFEEVY